MIVTRRAIDMAYAACLVMTGVNYAILASLGYSWLVEGYGLHPAMCLAVAAASSICCAVARPGSTL